MKSSAVRRLNGQRGQTLVMVAMLLTVLTGITSLSVDVGYERYQQRLQQSAADSAALAGAAEVAYGTSSATAAAKADAASNGFTDGSNGVTVTVDTDYSDAYTGGGTAVHVIVSKSYAPFFAGVINGGASTAVSASAVARMSANDNECLYQLNPSGAPNFNGMTYDGPKCGIIMNGTANFNGAHVDAASIGYQSGKTPNENGATFTEARPQLSMPAHDPCPQIAGCNYLTNNPPSTSSCVSSPNYNGAIVTLNPGCMYRPNFNGATITFNPGTYVFTGSPNFNGTHLSGSGVTLYFTSGACANFNGANLNLTPPTTGNEKGVLIYAAPGAGSCTPNFNGSSSTKISGLVYYPTYDVNFNGSLNSYTVLVVSDVNFNGSTQNFPDPPTNGTLVAIPALAE